MQSQQSEKDETNDNKRQTFIIYCLAEEISQFNICEDCLSALTDPLKQPKKKGG